MPTAKAREQKLTFRLTLVVEPDGEEFHAFCPTLKGLHTSGSTEQEALENAKDAAIAYLVSLIKHHDPIPLGCVVEARPAKPPVRQAYRDVRLEVIPAYA